MHSYTSKSDLFNGRRFEQESIILCVRWYLGDKHSYRDLVEIMAERGLSVSNTTIVRRVQRYAPELDKCWSPFATPAGTSWRVDESYVKMRSRRVIRLDSLDTLDLRIWSV